MRERFLGQLLKWLEACQKDYPSLHSDMNISHEWKQDGCAGNVDPLD
jgi:hypothetical protein